MAVNGGHAGVQKRAPIGAIIGDRKSLPIAKNHPKPSQEFREQIGPFLHNMKGFSKTSHQKVYPKFAKNFGRQILGNTFSGPKNFVRQEKGT